MTRASCEDQHGFFSVRRSIVAKECKSDLVVINGLPTEQIAGTDEAGQHDRLASRNAKYNNGKLKDNASFDDSVLRQGFDDPDLRERYANLRQRNLGDRLPSPSVKKGNPRQPEALIATKADQRDLLKNANIQSEIQDQRIDLERLPEDHCEVKLVSPVDPLNVPSGVPVTVEVQLIGCAGAAEVNFMLDNFDYALAGLDYFESITLHSPPWRVTFYDIPPGDTQNFDIAVYDSNSNKLGYYSWWLATNPIQTGGCKVKFIEPAEQKHYYVDSLPEQVTVEVTGCNLMDRLVLVASGRPFDGTWVLQENNRCDQHNLTLVPSRKYCLQNWNPPEAPRNSNSGYKIFATALHGDRDALGQKMVEFYVDWPKKELP